MKFPFTPQDILQQPFVRVRRNTVNLIVRCHHTDDVRFFDYFPEGVQECIPQKTFRDIDRAAIGTGLRLSVCSKVFQRCNDPLLRSELSITLKTFDSRDAHLSDKVWIFTKCFFHPAPARIASDIDNGSKSLMCAPGTNVFSNCRVYFFQKSGIKRRC